ncbi:MAG: hypothetical protein ACLGG7_00360 [Bacteriovoracia bacterium]
MLKLLGFALFATLFSGTTHAQLRDISLGTVTVSDLQTDLEIRDFQDLCNVVSIRAVMRKDKADIRTISVEFSDRAASQRFFVNQTLREGESTANFDLRGNRRCIDRFVIDASSRGSFWKPSRIELIATIDQSIRRPVPAPGPGPFPGPGPRPPFPGGGNGGRITQPDGFNVLFLSEIFVTEFDNRYSNPPFARPVCDVEAIMLQSLGDGTYIDRVTVMYQDGSLDDVRSPSYLAQRSESGWLRLDNQRWGGREMCIRNIQIIGRSELGGRRDRPSRINILGLRSRRF